jgi:hypothetical protein
MVFLQTLKVRLNSARNLEVASTAMSCKIRLEQNANKVKCSLQGTSSVSNELS